MVEMNKQNLLEAEKKEQEKREYVVKRKKDCYELENSERKKWDNVKGSRYDEDEDLCYIRYTATHGEWAGKNCESLKPGDKVESFTLRMIMIREASLCEENEFENSF